MWPKGSAPKWHRVARNLQFEEENRIAMKRIVLILFASLSVLSAQAQELEMFSLEKELEIPGASKLDILDSKHELVESIINTMQYYEVLEDNSGASIQGDRRTINYKGRDYWTSYDFVIEIDFRGDSCCTLHLFAVLIWASDKTTIFMCNDSLPITYEGHKWRYDCVSELQEARIAICDEVKLMLTSEFEAMEKDLIKILKSRGFLHVKLVQD